MDVYNDAVPSDTIPPELEGIEVMGWNLLIQPIATRTETDSGFQHADKTIDDMKYLRNIGKVVAKGPECYTDRATFTRLDDKGNPIHWCEIGDYVLYGKNRGARVYIKGHNLVLLADNLPLLKVTSPEDVDPFYNLIT